ncbi:MAG: PD-(D/E)XK nuclease family protein [Trichodesmium sp.]
MKKYQLSQQHLNLLTNCPRKFQHFYLDNLNLPITPTEQERLNRGSQFHLLMQQRELGLPIESLMLENQEMQNYFNNFFEAAPEISNSQTPDNLILRQAEHTRSINFNGYILTVIYDLLIADIEQAQIFDWKAYSYPQNKKKLAKNWQTRLYLYTLVETSNYSPEQISMTYWFIKPNNQEKPYKLEFYYNHKEHQKTQQDLRQILDKLTDYLKNYQQEGENLPQKPTIDNCQNCQFASRCQPFFGVDEQQENINSADISTNVIWNLDNIPEISIY